MLRSEFPHLRSRIPCLWSNSYVVSTVGGAPLAVIKQYICKSETRLMRKKLQPLLLNFL